MLFFFLYFLIFSGASIAFGAPSEPNSIQAALPQWGVYVWAASLAFGASCVLVGLHYQRKLGRASVNGALFEQVGMALLAAPGILYAVAVLAAVKWAGLYPAGLVLGMSVACGYRWWDIRRQIKAYLERKAKETAANGEG
jgi:hypothetical protein